MLKAGTSEHPGPAFLSSTGRTPCSKGPGKAERDLGILSEMRPPSSWGYQRAGAHGVDP